MVGIGSSAGGLEACQTLLKALPDNLGMAYVFLPHLDPARESAFREILARDTSMPVAEVTDGMPIAPDKVYVIPRNCEMTVSGGALHLVDREKPRSVHMTIDIFLRSLAAEMGRNAIGVVLSGTASDGTMGLTAIKGEGGITFAQDHSAKYDGMPSSAIASGSVDFVLPPEGIAHELARIADHPYVSEKRSSWYPRWRHPGKADGADIRPVAPDYPGGLFRVQAAHHRPASSPPHGAAQDGKAARLHPVYCSTTAMRLPRSIKTCSSTSPAFSAIRTPSKR